MPEPIEPSRTYLHLRDDLSAARVPVEPDFWATIRDRADLQGGRLLMRFDFTEDWDVQEMHPAGDELVILLSGSLDMHVEVDGAVERVELRQTGQLAIVPAGAWHTADVLEPSSALFVTPGEGTLNEPRHIGR